MQHFAPRFACLLGIAFFALTGTASAQFSGQIDLAPPGDREFVLDTIDLIDDADEQTIKQIAGQLLTDKAAPIIVVTIESMARHGGAGLRIETFARLLFDQWGIGPAKIGDQLSNYGMLLLVSRDDRKARIELGAGWKRDKDAVAETIMSERIIPRFKNGDFSAGILAGVEGLNQLARDVPLAASGVSPNSISTGNSRPNYLLWSIGIGLLIFTVVSLFRRGTSGWGWLFWTGLLMILGQIVYAMVTHQSGRRSGRSGRSGGGGFSGGSFGGGFSGGGGATGSW